MARTTKAKVEKEETKVEENVKSDSELPEKIEEKKGNEQPVQDADNAVQKTEGMTVCEAMEAIKNGKAVRRKAWTGTTCIHIRRGETIPLYFIGRYFGPYQPSFDDMRSSDWEIVTDFKE